MREREEEGETGKREERSAMPKRERALSAEEEKGAERGEEETEGNAKRADPDKQKQLSRNGND